MSAFVLMLLRIRIQLRIFRVPDPDPTHTIKAYLEIVKKHLKFNQKEDSTRYEHLPFSISYYCPTVHIQQSRIHRPKIRNTIFIIYLLRSMRIRIHIHNTALQDSFHNAAIADPDQLRSAGSLLNPESDLLRIACMLCLKK